MNVPLSNQDIERALRGENGFRGVYSYDLLPNLKQGQSKSNHSDKKTHFTKAAATYRIAHQFVEVLLKVVLGSFPQFRVFRDIKGHPGTLAELEDLVHFGEFHSER